MVFIVLQKEVRQFCEDWLQTSQQQQKALDCRLHRTDPGYIMVSGKFSQFGLVTKLNVFIKSVEGANKEEKLRADSGKVSWLVRSSLSLLSQ